MTNYHDPHAEIMEVGFAPLSDVTLQTALGDGDVDIIVSGERLFPLFEWPQSASFTQKKSASGNYVDQELEVVFTDSSADFVAAHRSLLDTDCIVLVRYTNGQVLVAGTEEAPVRCEWEDSGSPKTLRISFSRKSPEFAKVLKSLR